MGAASRPGAPLLWLHASPSFTRVASRGISPQQHDDPLSAEIVRAFDAIQRGYELEASADVAENAFELNYETRHVTAARVV